MFVLQSQEHCVVRRSAMRNLRGRVRRSGRSAHIGGMGVETATKGGVNKEIPEQGQCEINSLHTMMVNFLVAETSEAVVI